MYKYAKLMIKIFMLKALICSKPKDRINSCMYVDANGYSYGSFTVMTTFQSITDIMNNKDKNNFKTPEFQADLDEDKIQEMVDSFRTCKSHFLSQLLLTIANIKIAGEEINYIMDGQHRMEMIKILYEKYGENMQVILAIHIVNDEDRLKQLFETLNKDSTKNLTYVKLPIFKKQAIDQFRKALLDKYVNCYEKKKKQSSHIKTVNELIDDLEQNDYFSSNGHLTTLELLAKIDTDHIGFLNYVGYLEQVCKPHTHYYKDEETMIKECKNVIFFKNNNFVQYVCYTEDPIHNFTKNTRTGVSSTLRKKVWENHYGGKTNGICPIIGCNQMLSSKIKSGFQCGHIISVKNGGKNDVLNLRPICANCNSKMSSTNWDIFVTEQECNIIESEGNLFDEIFEKRLQQKMEENSDEECDGTIDCYRCSKSIIKVKSQLIQIDGNNQLVCQKCCTQYKNMDLKLKKHKNIILFS